MDDVVVFGRARFTQVEYDLMRDIQSQVMELMQTVPGFVSVSLWEETADPFSFCTLSHYATEADAVYAWNTLIRADVFEVISKLLSTPPDLLRFRVRSVDGLRLESTPPGTFLSSSVRIADLGYEESMIEEMVRIFEELKVISGCRGSMVGQHVEVPQEVVGFVFWDSRHSYEKSLPKQPMYDVDLFQRVL